MGRDFTRERGGGGLAPQSAFTLHFTEVRTQLFRGAALQASRIYSVPVPPPPQPSLPRPTHKDQTKIKLGSNSSTLGLGSCVAILHIFSANSPSVTNSTSRP